MVKVLGITIKMEVDQLQSKTFSQIQLFTSYLESGNIVRSFPG